MEARPIDSKITKITIALFVLNILAIIVFADRISLTLHDVFPALCFAYNILTITSAYSYERQKLKWYRASSRWYGLHSAFYIIFAGMAHRIITADKNDREKKFDLILPPHQVLKMVACH